MCCRLCCASPRGCSAAVCGSHNLAKDMCVVSARVPCKWAGCVRSACTGVGARSKHSKVDASVGDTHPG